MKTPLLTALAFGAMTSVALAAPVALTDTQMDTVTAGALIDVQLQTAAGRDLHVTGGHIPQTGGSSIDIEPCLIWDIDGANVTGQIVIMLREPRDY
jgi:hypothetical protein